MIDETGELVLLLYDFNLHEVITEIFLACSQQKVLRPANTNIIILAKWDC